MVLGVPPVFEIVTALPGFATVHNTRLTILFLICVALLAGLGLDELTTSAESLPRRRLVLAGVAAVLAVPLAWLVGARPSPSLLDTALGLASGLTDPVAQPGDQPRTFDIHSIRLSALIVWLVVAGAALALVWLRVRGRLAATAFTALAVAVIVVDLFRAGVGQNPAIAEAARRSAQDRRHPPPRATPAGPLRRHRPARLDRPTTSRCGDDPRALRRARV